MTETKTPIRRWPNGERPRERLRQAGPGALSLEELLAILVGSGGPERSAVEIARVMLSRSERRLRALGALPVSALEALPGVGRATAARVVAALELGRRTAREEHPERFRIRGPRDVYDRMAVELRDLPHEEFHALLLNTQHRVLSQVLLTRGILDASLIHPREVFRAAVLECASALVLVHNHPSGDPTPSPEDRAVTRQIERAGKTMGIRVLDHVIIGDGRWCSLAEEGELDR